METFGGAIQLMLFVYAIATLIALATAAIIKFIFYVIKLQHGRAMATAKPAATAAVRAKQTA